MLSCRQFAAHVANGELPLKGKRFQFWMHWTICPFCRRYWKEIRAIGHLHHANSVLAHHPVVKLDEVKRRLKDQMRARFS